MIWALLSIAENKRGYGLIGQTGPDGMPGHRPADCRRRQRTRGIFTNTQSGERPGKLQLFSPSNDGRGRLFGPAGYITLRLAPALVPNPDGEPTITVRIPGGAVAVVAGEPVEGWWDFEVGTLRPYGLVSVHPDDTP